LEETKKRKKKINDINSIPVINNFKNILMKKYFFIAFAILIASPFSFAQPDKTKYPEPEYSNEIYLLKKDSSKLCRLEKGSSKMKTKTKMGGMGGSESSYSIEGESSPIRFTNGSDLCFILYTGKQPGFSSTPQMDSAMKANGTNAQQMNEAMEMFNNPEKNTSLYDMDPEKDQRKIIAMSNQGMKILGKAKKESKKYTLSIKKVKEGYYEILVDKTLPKGEYSFLVMDMMSRDMSYKLFAFGID